MCVDKHRVPLGIVIVSNQLNGGRNSHKGHGCLNNKIRIVRMYVTTSSAAAQELELGVLRLTNCSIRV